MNRSVYLFAAAACVVSLSGCDWGGAHENTWNDAYSWLNFTGTYKLANAVQVAATSTEDDGGSVSSETTESQYPGSMSFKTSSATKIVSGVVNQVGQGVVPGTFSVNVGGKIVGSDDKAGGIAGTGIAKGSIDYSSGTWSVECATAAPAGVSVSVTWKYKVQGMQPVDPKKPEKAQSIMTYLHVNQNGNVLYMTDSNGVKYQGKITGASVPNSTGHGYENAGSAYVSFDVSAANGAHIVGTLNGQWSGAMSPNSGVLSGRTLNATYQSGRSSADFYGIGGDMTISLPNTGD